jgi:hypothetical protein|tara:strand:- start:291 stop:455 length:165 start_codon:yes stop_codon:yes gene_type:complete
LSSGEFKAKAPLGFSITRRNLDQEFRKASSSKFFKVFGIQCFLRRRVPIALPSA